MNRPRSVTQCTSVDQSDRCVILHRSPFGEEVSTRLTDPLPAYACTQADWYTVLLMNLYRTCFLDEKPYSMAFKVNRIACHRICANQCLTKRLAHDIISKLIESRC